MRLAHCFNNKAFFELEKSPFKPAVPSTLHVGGAGVAKGFATKLIGTIISKESIGNYSLWTDKKAKRRKEQSDLIARRNH